MTDPISSITATGPAGAGPFGVSASRRSPQATDAAAGTGTAAAAQPGAASAGATLDSVAQAVETLQRYAAQAGAELSFRVDEELDRIIVTVLDRRDGTVLRQIPSEEALRISRMIAEARAGLVEGAA
jgi:flagellar protein FlaG